MDQRLNEYIAMLLKKEMKDMYQGIFKNNPNYQECRVKILSNNNTKLTPFRNVKCVMPDCIYDIEDLKPKIKLIDFDDKKSFECNYCHKHITLRDFYVDTTLKNYIDYIWNNVNTKKIIIKTIIQSKDGICVPELTEQESESNKKIIKGLKGRVFKQNTPINGSKEGSIINTIDDKPTSTEKKISNLFYSTLPSLHDSTLSELKILKAKYIKNKDANHVIFTAYNKEITVGDIVLIESMNQIMKKLMFCYILYTINFLFLYDKSNRTYIFPVIVTSFDESNMNIEYETLILYKFFLSKNDQDKFLLKYDKIMLCIQYQNQWLLSIYYIQRLQLKLIHFIQPHINHAAFIIKSILAKEFQMTPDNISHDDKNALKYTTQFQDYSLPLCKVMHDLLIEKLPLSKLNLTEVEISDFVNDLTWLFLKMASQNLTGFRSNQQSIAASNYNDDEAGDVGDGGGKDDSQKEEYVHIYGFEESYDDTNPSNSVIRSQDQENFKEKNLIYLERKNEQNTKAGLLSHQANSLNDKDIVNGNKIRIRKSDLLEIFHMIQMNAKADLKDGNITLYDLLEQEGLLDLEKDLDKSRFQIKKSRLIEILYKFKDNVKKQGLLEGKPDKKKQEQEKAKEHDKATKEYDHYMKTYENYIQDVQKFQSDLYYLQQANPSLYQKVEQEVNSQLFKKLAEKHNSQKAQYHRVNSNPLVVKSSSTSALNPNDNIKSNQSKPGFNQYNRYNASNLDSSLPPIPNKASFNMGLPRRKSKDLKSNDFEIDLKQNLPLRKNSHSKSEILLPPIQDKPSFNLGLEKIDKTNSQTHDKSLKSELNKPSLFQQNSYSSLTSRVENKAYFNMGIAKLDKTNIQTKNSNELHFNLGLMHTPLQANLDSYQTSQKYISKKRIEASLNQNKLKSYVKLPDLILPDILKNVDTTQKDPIKVENEIITQRYGINIFKNEFEDINLGIISMPIVNLLIKYLEEKQEYLIHNNKSGLYIPKILYFTNDFFDKLTNYDPNTTHIDYQAVKNLTRTYIGHNNHIFIIFDAMVFINSMDENQYSVVLVISRKKKIILYEGSSTSNNLEPLMHPMVSQVAQYVGMEYMDKASIKMDVGEWDYEKGQYEIDKENDNENDDALMMINLLYKIQLGIEIPVVTKSGSKKFKTSLKNLLKSIGISKSVPGELQFNKLPLQVKTKRRSFLVYS